MSDDRDKNGNVNCLQGLECPHCGHYRSLDIRATSVFRVADGGAEEHQDVEYGDSSATTCPSCNFSSALADFRIGSAESRAYIDITRE